MLPKSKPIFDFHTLAPFNPEAKLYVGFVPIKDSKGKLWWSDVQVSPSETHDCDEQVYLESRNTLYRVVPREDFPEGVGLNSQRYLPPLKEVKTYFEDQAHHILEGFDEGIGKRIKGLVNEINEEWYDVTFLDGQDRAGYVRYLR